MDDPQFETTDTPERPVRLGDATIDMGASEGDLQTVQAEYAELLMVDSAQPMQASVSDHDDLQVAIVHEDSKQVSPPSTPSPPLSPLSASESPTFHSGARRAHSSRPNSRSASPTSRRSRHVTFESPEPYTPYASPFIPPIIPSMDDLEISTPAPIPGSWFPPPRSLPDASGSGYSVNDWFTPESLPPGFVPDPLGTYRRNSSGPPVGPFQPVIPPATLADWGAGWGPSPTQDAYWNANLHGYAGTPPFGAGPANPWDYMHAPTPSLRSRRSTFEYQPFAVPGFGGGYKPNFNSTSESLNTPYTNDSYGLAHVERHPTGFSRTSPSPPGTPPVPLNPSSPLLGATQHLQSSSPFGQEQTLGLIGDDDEHVPSTRRVPYSPGQTPFIPPLGFVPLFFEPYGDHSTADEAHTHRSAHSVVYPPHVVFNPDVESIKDVDDLEPDITPEAQIWKSYAEEAMRQDKDTIANWNQSMDVILVFAGLFSAILTAFIIEFYKLLQPDPQQTAADLLLNITLTLQAVATGQPPASYSNSSAGFAEDFILPGGVLCVNALWFTSLACSLGSAMAAMVIKQWLQYYALNLNGGSHYDYAHRRQYRFNALQAWHVPGIISALPVAMHMSVGLFLVGLVVQLWQINTVIAVLACAFIATLLGSYAVTLLLPLVYPACPYKSSFSVLVQESLHYLYVGVWQVLVQALVLVQKWQPQLSSLIPLTKVQSYYKIVHSSGPKKLESGDISKCRSDLDIDGIVWLLEVSQKPEVANLSLKSLQELQHTNNMIQQLMNNDVMGQLADKAYVHLPAHDDEFWGKLKPQHIVFKKLANATVFMHSLMFVWHHPQYLSQNQPPVLSKQDRHSPYGPLFGEWLYLWRSLKSDHSSPLEMGQHGYDLNVFAVLICAEAHHYHLHPTCLPLHSHLDLTNDANPFVELVQLLTCASVTPKALVYLHDDSVCLLLDTLAYALSNMETPTHVFMRQDILQILLQLIESRYMTSDTPLVLQRLLTCVQMFQIKPSLDRRALAQEDHKDLSKTELHDHFGQIYRDIIQQYLTRQFILYEGSNAPSIIPTAVYLLYQNLLWQNKPKATYDYVFVNLPSESADLCLERILALRTTQWKTIHAVEWYIGLLCKWHLNGHLSEKSKEKNVIFLINLLGYKWPDEDLKIVATKVFSFITQLMAGSNVNLANVVSTCLCDTLAASFHPFIGDHHLLDQFIDLEALDKVIDFLQSATRSHVSVETWAKFAQIWTDDHTELRGSTKHELALSRLFNVTVIVPPDESSNDQVDEESEVESADTSLVQMLSPIMEGHESLASNAHAFVEQELPADIWEPNGSPSQNGSSESIPMISIEPPSRPESSLYGSDHNATAPGTPEYMDYDLQHVPGSSMHTEGLLFSDENPEHDPPPQSSISHISPLRFSNDDDDPWTGFTTYSSHQIVYQGNVYPSAYHLLQALGFLEHRPDLAEQIRTCISLQDVYNLSRTWDEHANWDQVEMKKDEVLYLKFKQHPELCRLLIDTYPAELIYTADDPYLGQDAAGVGGNELGKALMRVRDQLIPEM